jgi:hypothetical protein
MAAIATSQAWTLTAVGASGPGTAELDLREEIEPVHMYLAYRAQPRPAMQKLVSLVVSASADERATLPTRSAG